MNAKQHMTVVFIFVLSLLVSGCGPGQLFGPPVFVAVVAGNAYTCALTTGGEVKCWGLNDSGQLGDSTTVNRATPVAVKGLSGGVKAITAGGSHACVLTLNGRVKCWGSNGTGQLGDGTTINRATPVDVKGLESKVIAIAAGQGHTCALISSPQGTSSGGVKCWGLNGYGQLGNGAVTTKMPFGKTTPVDVTGLTGGVRAIAAGQGYTCALVASPQETSSGGVKCWGYNMYGQLGNGAASAAPPYVITAPMDVSGLTSGVSAISAGHEQTCALISSPQKTSGNGVKCWGTNGYGELGDGTTTNRATPISVNGLTSGISALAAGYQYTCALTLSGGVKCWGGGRWGDSESNYSPTPVDVSGLTSGVSAIAAGHGHICILTSSGVIKCRGQNDFGQLGDGTTINHLEPVEIKP